VAAHHVIHVRSRRPIEPDFAAAERQLLLPALRKDLRRAGVVFLSTALAAQIGGERRVDELAGDGPLNHDSFPRLDSLAAKDYFLHASANGLAASTEQLDPERAPDLFLGRYLRWRRRPLSSLEWADIVLFPRHPVEGGIITRYIERWARAYPGDYRALRALLASQKSDGQLDEARATLRDLRRIRPGDPKLDAIAAELGQ
jgi:hypothetical protein